MARCEYPGGVISEATGCLPPEQVEQGFPGSTTSTTIARPADHGGIGGLPVTGGDALGLAAIGVFCAVAGTALIRRAHRIGRAS